MTKRAWIETGAYDELRHELGQRIRYGEFTLASGATSDWYLDCREVTFSQPVLVGEAIGSCLVAQPWGFDCLAGVAVGGVPMAVATACDLFGLLDLVPTIGIRPEPKDHGRGGCVMGAPWGKPTRPAVVVMDDVFTTGGSLQKATQRLREEWDVDPVAYLTLFNRNPDRQDLVEFCGVPFISLYGLKDLGVK